MSKLIDIATAKAHLRLGDIEGEDELVQLKVDMAVAIASDFTNRDLDAEFKESPESLPGAIKAAILLILGTLYDNESDQLVGRSVSQLSLSAEKLLMMHRQSPMGE